MNTLQFAPFLIFAAISFFMLGRKFERFILLRRDSAAARRIREKYQAAKGSSERV